MSRKKRPFLLMEVMIALSILALFIVPLMRMPILHFQKQIDHLAQFEKQRIADWAFSEIKEQLLKNTISWELLPKKGDSPLAVPLSKTTLEIPGLQSRIVSRSFEITCKGEKEGIRGDRHRLLEIAILLDQEKIAPSYRILVSHL